MNKQPIEDPNELLHTIEQTIRKNISSAIALYEFNKIDEDVSHKLIKTDRFLLALVLKLKEELGKH